MYVVTGATGHTGNIVARTLLDKGAKVRVIGRSADRLEALVAKGVESCVTDLTDVSSLAKSFDGAKAAYVMLPPSLTAPDYRQFQDRVTETIAAALRSAGITHVVTLSSIGADKPDRTGPVLGLRYLEQQLNHINGLHVLHLRAGYFMENTLAQVGIIQKMGMSLGPLRPDLKLSMIATEDVGVVAADALLRLDFHQKNTRELQGQRDLSMNEVAQIIGKAIGNPGLRYTQAPDDQVQAALIQLGMSSSMAALLLEMSAALNSGYMRALEPRSAENTTPTSYEAFAAEKFKPLYEGKSAAA
ncbi:MAG TPA: NmrA family NAD(P)-binding protein [Terriglobales bacterium]|nr:NmrA family NAD(P)-binding protein [Terriglobales bacterium]